MNDDNANEKLRLRGVPVFIDPSIGTNMVHSRLLGAGFELIIVDSIETFRELKAVLDEIDKKGTQCGS